MLAVSTDGVLFSWGRGKSGRLGHHNDKDVFTPKVVSYFNQYYVEGASAGDAHSVVLMRSRRGERTSQPLMMSTFGRGAHGRLGLGHNRSISTPAIIRKWPPSAEGYIIREVACGGAHTLVLMYKEVPVTLANPYGVATSIYAFGFAANGQLGTGDLKDSFVPIKVKMPKWEIVTHISAGRSWSLARTVGGDLYSWGKGLRGQLGHGAARPFSIAPRKVDTFAAFLKISSGYSHNMCISTTKKYLNGKDVEKFVSSQKHRAASVFSVPPELSLGNYTSRSMKAFHCCRRSNFRLFDDVRFECVDCGLKSICYVCDQQCHRGHEIIECSVPKGERQFCECSVYYPHCRLLPPISEYNPIDESDGDRFVGNCTERELKAVRSIQGLARSYIGFVQIKRMKKYVRKIRRIACETYWHEVILPRVHETFESTYEKYRKERENMEMKLEDESRKMYDFYYNLQSALMGMDLLLSGSRMLLGQASIVTTATAQEILLMKLKKQASKAIVTTVPSLTFSWHSFRAQQLGLHWNKRLSPMKVAHLTKFYPRYVPHEGVVSDSDVVLIYQRYVRSSRVEHMKRMKHKKQEEEKQVQVEASKNATSSVATGSLAVSQIKDKGQPAQLTKGKSVAAMLMSDVPKSQSAIARRHSICDPCKLYSRLISINGTLAFRSKIHRRNSIPDRMSRLYVDDMRSAPSYEEGVCSSLDMYSQRLLQLMEFVDPAFNVMWSKLPKGTKNRRMIKTLQSAILNPRLPWDARESIEAKAFHVTGRRRTIADPERLARQLKVMFDIRNSVAHLRRKARKREKLAFRRRSFDFGEWRDDECQINETLGYVLEEPFEVPTVYELRSDLLKMEKCMVLISTASANPSMSGSLPPTARVHAAVSSVELWKEYFTEEGYKYYFNDATGESKWELPIGSTIQILSPYYDENYGEWYWYNNTTGETSY